MRNTDIFARLNNYLELTNRASQPTQQQTVPALNDIADPEMTIEMNRRILQEQRQQLDALPRRGRITLTPEEIEARFNATNNRRPR